MYRRIKPSWLLACARESVLRALAFGTGACLALLAAALLRAASLIEAALALVVALLLLCCAERERREAAARLAALRADRRVKQQLRSLQGVNERLVRDLKL